MSDAVTSDALGANAANKHQPQHRQTAAPSPWRRRLSHLAAVILGTVLLVAAWAKLLDPSAFAATIRGEQLDFLLSATAVAFIALGLEIALGVALVLGMRQRWVLWPTTALVAFFVFLTGRAYWRSIQGTLPEDAGCGCFGNLVERTPAEAFWQDLLLLVPPLLIAFLGLQRAGRFPRLRVAIVALVTVAALVFAWRAPSLPLDNLATRLKPGVSVGNLCAGAEGERTCMDGVIPELEVGEHLVILTNLDEPIFLDAIEGLNDRFWARAEPPVWVLSAASDDERFNFQFTRAPAFDVSAAPTAVVRPLYRTLPRSFRVRDGQVIDTWSGLPPGILDGTSAAPSSDPADAPDGSD